MYLDTRVIESANVIEYYIVAASQTDLPLQKKAEEIFSGISNTLRAAGAWIFEERVFATENAMDVIVPVRKKAYGDLDDGVGPTCLVVPDGTYGEIAGVQVHAISYSQKPKVLMLNGKACGRTLRYNGKKYLSLSCISADKAGQDVEQARAMFEKTESALRQSGGDMRSVVRTWIWLDDILCWYKDFNKVRTQFFNERGLIKEIGKHHLPASTGIGAVPAGGEKCALDLFAVVGDQDSTKFYLKGGEQSSAFDYGSAFSRASRTTTPAGEAVFVSGTAAVDQNGATEHVDDIINQIKSTINHLRAILKDAGCRDQEIVQMIAYCKTVKVEKVFRKMCDDLKWPIITAICDICRDNLLFELEAIAYPGARIRSLRPSL